MNEENKDYTLGELEEMDLTELMDKVFMVAVSKGDRNKSTYLCDTLCGPMNFYEMVETVGNIYVDHQIHAKAIITTKEFGTKPRILDENTIDFIEARFQDIIMDGLLGGELTSTKEYTCKAGFVREEESEKVH